MVFKPTQFELIDRAERLRAARLGAGFKSAKAAALELGIPYPTFAGHENGSRGIKDAELVAYSKAFKVSLNWLAFGNGKIVRKLMLPLLDCFEHSSDMEKRKTKLSSDGFIEVDAPFPIEDGWSVVKIPDERFFPHYFSGDLLLVIVTESPRECIGKRSIFLIEKVDADETIKLVVPGTVLREGDKAGTFDVQEPTGRLHLNGKVVWSALVCGIVPKVSNVSVQTD